MELNRRSVLAAIGAGTAAAALAGCGGGSTAADSADGPAEGEITLLTPIYEGANGKTLLEQEILGGFRKKYPDVKVNVDYTTYQLLNEKITTALAGGLLPDVLMMGVGWIPPFAAKKAIAELPESLATAHDYEKRVLEPSRYDGKLYALPVILDTRIVVYRKDHFAEAGIKKTPANWAELRAVAKQLTKDGRLGFDPFSIELRQCWETFLFANGGRLFSEDGKKVLFTEAGGVEALQFFKDLIKDGSVDYAKKTDPGAPSNVQTGKASMMMSTSALWVQAKEQNPELIEGDKLGAFVLANRRPADAPGRHTRHPVRALQAPGRGPCARRVPGDTRLDPRRGEAARLGTRSPGSQRVRIRQGEPVRRSLPAEPGARRLGGRDRGLDGDPGKDQADAGARDRGRSVREGRHRGARPSRRGRHRTDVRTRHCVSDIRSEGTAHAAAFPSRGTEAEA